MLKIILHDDRPQNVRLADNLQVIRACIELKRTEAPDSFYIRTVNGTEYYASNVWLEADENGDLFVGWKDPIHSKKEVGGRVALDIIETLKAYW